VPAAAVSVPAAAACSPAPSERNSEVSSSSRFFFFRFIQFLSLVVILFLGILSGPSFLPRVRKWVGVEASGGFEDKRRRKDYRAKARCLAFAFCPPSRGGWVCCRCCSYCAMARALALRSLACALVTASRCGRTHLCDTIGAADFARWICCRSAHRIERGPATWHPRGPSELRPKRR
jgi:hypothetical protein